MKGIDINEIVEQIKKEDSNSGRLLLFGMAVISAITYHRKTKQKHCLHETMDAMGIEETYDIFFDNDFKMADDDIKYAIEHLFIKFTPAIHIDD